MPTAPATLYQLLTAKTDTWRAAGYPSAEYPIIAEILSHQRDPATASLTFLREPQMRALETYWYLRLVEDTPHVFDLYQRLFSGNRALREAVGATAGPIRDLVEDEGIAALWQRIKSDEGFVKTYSLQALRETLTLDYPSYILALAMGAGKTILIGAIIATEFALALEYPDGPFVENALVFAPGKTIIESLRELSQIPYDKLIPPRLYKAFVASYKLAFTRDGELDLPVIRGSTFNIVVTNTEKIRIQRTTVAKRKGWTQLQLAQEEKQAEEIANRRLQAIASLPNLAIFSDEAHHTYGQDIEKGLKRVRQTVDYLAAKTQVRCVINTTGTPYFGKQLLKDVVVWYGLAQGIADGILKEVEDSIQSYRFDSSEADTFVTDVTRDFFRDYATVTLPNGAPAKIAFYFPQDNDLEELRPVLEAALATVGQSPTVLLKNTAKSSADEITAFNALNDPASPYRVILLVNKGTEGWNCPSLFACVLARELTTSNNFVLQAATRCLRQVPGNHTNARIYLSEKNRRVLDSQLQETYGETIGSLSKTAKQRDTYVLTLRKHDVPPLPLTLTLRTVTRVAVVVPDLRLTLPDIAAAPALEKEIRTLRQVAGSKELLPVVDEVAVARLDQTLDLYTVAVDLAATYRLPPATLTRLLAQIYPTAEVPADHLPALAAQIEVQTGRYETRTEQVTAHIAIVKPAGWLDAKTGLYTKTITIDPAKADLIMALWTAGNPADLGFHYDPYNFDSVPEASFYRQMLEHLNLQPAAVEDIYYTGGTTDPDRTDFFFDWTDAAGVSHQYFPDFLIRLKPAAGEPPGSGACLIVEIKNAQFEATVTAELAAGKAVSAEGRKALAVKRLADRHPDRIRYSIIFAPAGELTRAKVKPARDWVEEATP
ncbi:MAG: DEAD/DEAH box helicase family protein [Chloroflexota bacterium]|nr:DEAD/DEAH box helicase family protein [Chloroflexota bacterium]